VMNALIGGWEVSGIFIYRSGLPFGTGTGSFPIGFVTESGAVLRSANLGALQQNIHNANDGTIQFFGDQATALNSLRFPQHGEIGNRNILRGSGYWNLDTGLIKNFQLPGSETRRLQFQWQSFNIFNHNSFGLPNANIGSTLFGQITSSASAPRE